MDLNLKGRVALVTGGSRGIGKAIAATLAAEGCDVMLVARTEADLKAAAAEIAGASGRRVLFQAADLRTRAACDAAVEAHKAAFGRLDILVNNAGATQGGDFLELDDAVWEDGFALKFYSYVRMARGLWPLLKAAGDGAVINIGGGFARTPNHNFMIGGAVNAAVTNFTKALANRGVVDGISVNAVHPGMTRTDRFEMLLRQRAKAENTTPEALTATDQKRLGIRSYSKPEDIAALVAFLVSPLGRQVHGADVFIDAGGQKSIL